MYRRILVAFDGSDGAQAALRSAVALASASGGMVHLVQSTGHLQETGDVVIGDHSTVESSVREALDRAASQLEEVEAVTRVVRGDPVAGIIAAAEAIHADLIVTGSRGPAMIPQAVLGRVTSGVVSGSRCDVLVVQPHQRP